MLRYSVEIKDIITERMAYISYVSFGSMQTFLDVLDGKNKDYTVEDMIDCGNLTYRMPTAAKLISNKVEEICYVWTEQEMLDKGVL